MDRFAIPTLLPVFVPCVHLSLSDFKMQVRDPRIYVDRGDIEGVGVVLYNHLSLMCGQEGIVKLFSSSPSSFSESLAYVRTS